MAKKKDGAAFTIRIPRDMEAHILALAAENRRSKAAEVEVLLGQALKALEGPDPK